MAISGKSSSMAALVLMVAVLAVTANAQLSVSNLCNQTVNITTGAVANLSIGAGATVNVNVTAVTFLTAPVTVTILAQTRPVAIPIAPGLISFLLKDQLLAPFATIVNITINCSSSNCITITAIANITIFFITVPLRTTIGPICA